MSENSGAGLHKFYIYYDIKLLGEHGSFNRISFGDTLWKSIMCQSIVHDCAVWVPSSNATIASLVCLSR
jgi:hypothetical protein